MATTQAPANFNILDKDKDLNKDYNRLNKGLKILKGNRWASFFGASNYQRLQRSYRRQFIQKRSDGKGGVILFDTRTQQPTNDKLINEAIVKNVTGSSNPTADLKYINAIGRAEIQKNLGNLKDGVSLNDIFFHTKRLFSDPVYNTKGEKIGKEIDLKRNLKSDELRIQASEASLGTKYDEFLDPASPAYKGGGKEIAKITTVGDKVIRTDGDIPPNGSTQPKSLDQRLLEEAGGGSTSQPSKVSTEVVENIKNNNTNSTSSQSLNTTVPDTALANKESSDLPNRGSLKSDVFTLGADGKPLGVMTRAQRRKWDANNQELLKRNALTIANRTYSSGNIGTGSG